MDHTHTHTFLYICRCFIVLLFVYTVSFNFLLVLYLISVLFIFLNFSWQGQFSRYLFIRTDNRPLSLRKSTALALPAASAPSGEEKMAMGGDGDPPGDRLIGVSWNANGIVNARKRRVDDEQRGFRKGRGCVDQIFTVKILVEKYLEIYESWKQRDWRSGRKIWCGWGEWKWT